MIYNKKELEITSSLFLNYSTSICGNIILCLKEWFVSVFTYIYLLIDEIFKILLSERASA